MFDTYESEKRVGREILLKNYLIKNPISIQWVTVVGR